MRSHQEPLGSRAQRFFFEPEVPYGLALIRILLPLILMGMVLPRWSAVREIYSTDGATSPLAVGYGYLNLLPEYSGSVAVALYAVMMFALFSVCVGWCTRASLIIANILFTYFCMLDSISTMTKYTVIATHMMFILALSECGSLWSIDSWLAGRKRGHWPGEPSVQRQKFAAWPRRLMQFHIGCVYFGAALTKMHTPTFFSGDQLQFWMQTHINFEHPIGEYLSLYPILLVAFGYVVIVWEVVFLFISWKSMWRMFILPVGVLFHFMTTITLGLLMFPMICYCTYLSFMDEDDVQQISAWCRKRIRSSSWLKAAVQRIAMWRERIGDPVGWKNASRVVFTAGIVVFSIIHVELEYWSDPYQERRPEGKMALKTVDPELARRILAPTEEFRDEDKFFAVDTGTILVGELLANRRREFRHGEKMIAQCNIVPPHEDMALECRIVDENNRIVERLPAVATREMFRANFNHVIDETMLPGDYTLVVGTAGRKVVEKKITVLPRRGSTSVN